MDEKSASPIVMEFMSGFGKELRIVEILHAL